MQIVYPNCIYRFPESRFLVCVLRVIFLFRLESDCLSVVCRSSLLGSIDILWWPDSFVLLFLAGDRSFDICVGFIVYFLRHMCVVVSLCLLYRPVLCVVSMESEKFGVFFWIMYFIHIKHAEFDSWNIFQYRFLIFKGKVIYNLYRSIIKKNNKNKWFMERKNQTEIKLSGDYVEQLECKFLTHLIQARMQTIQ